MLHSMLKYSEIATNLNFICIPTTPLEFRKYHNIMNADINNDEYVNKTEDEIDVENVCHNARINLEFHQWRQFAPNQILLETKRKLWWNIFGQNH